MSQTMAEYLIIAMPREYPLRVPTDKRSHPYLASPHPRPSPASSIPVTNFSSLPDKPADNEDTSYFKLAQALQAASIQDSEVHTPAPHPPPERLQCAACHIPIVTPTGTVDADHFPVLWRLAHCRHPLHLDCLAPLGHPYAISRVTQRPNYVHNPAATRVRRQKRHNPQFDHRPISRFEDAERMRTWLCPQDGCGQVQFSVLSHGDWYSNVHGMTIDGHSISGPTHL